MSYDDTASEGDVDMTTMAVNMSNISRITNLNETNYQREGEAAMELVVAEGADIKTQPMPLLLPLQRTQQRAEQQTDQISEQGQQQAQLNPQRSNQPLKLSLRQSSAENDKLRTIILSQQSAQKILEEQIQHYKAKEEHYNEVDRKRRGSEMLLASLGERIRMMESSEKSVRAQLLEATASQEIVQNEIRENLNNQAAIKSMMENHRAFTSSYEMRVAELESENGELHGFMAALMNDPTVGMLTAVLGFYRGRYYEGGEWRGATAVEVGGVGEGVFGKKEKSGGQEAAFTPTKTDNESKRTPVNAPNASSVSPAAAAFNIAATLNNTAENSANNVTNNDYMPRYPAPHTPSKTSNTFRTASPPAPRYANHTRRSTVRKQVIEKDGERRKKGGDVRREQWLGGVASHKGVLLHGTSTAAANSNADSPADPESIAARTRSYTSGDKVHSHVPGVRLGDHGGTVRDNERAKKESVKTNLSNSGDDGSHWTNVHKVSPRLAGEKRKDEKIRREDSPIRWFTTTDPNSGLDYWYNPWSGETTWHKPKDFDQSRGAIYNRL